MKCNKLGKSLEHEFASFSIYVDIIPYAEGANRFFFLLKLHSGVKYESVLAIAEDVRMVLAIPVLIPFIIENTIFLCVSFDKSMPNRLIPIIKNRIFNNCDKALPIAIGYDLFGCPFVDDLADAPHLLYAGTTNSGKSMGLISLLLSLTVFQEINTVNIIIFDIGATSLQCFEELPHLSHPIVNDQLTGIHVLKLLVEEMERRITMKYEELKLLPALVCVIDEYTSLIANTGEKCLSDEYKKALNNLLRRGRKAKVHMVLATQNATQEAMQSDTGNITTRIAFHVPSPQASKAIVGETGAERLSRRGELLYKSPTLEKALHLQGTYVDNKEIHNLISFIKSRTHDCSEKFIIPTIDSGEQIYQSAIDVLPPSVNNSSVELCKVILWTLSQNKISAKSIKSSFKMGNRANLIIDELYDLGIISEKCAKQPRTVLPNSIEDLSDKVMRIFDSNSISSDIINQSLEKRISNTCGNDKDH